MAASTRWICTLCREMVMNLTNLEDSFKKGTVANDGEEAWMGCMTCNQSLHVKCLLTQVMEEEANRRLKKAPVNNEGKCNITGQELIDLSPYQCKKWYVSHPN